MAGHHGHLLTVDDQLRARAIEMLMWRFKIEINAFREEFGTVADSLAPIHAETARKFADYTALDSDMMRILPAGRPLVRLIANSYDEHCDVKAQFSKLS